MSPDWDRVLFYARRIKQLGVDDSREVVMSHIDISVYKFLSVYRPNYPIGFNYWVVPRLCHH